VSAGYDVRLVPLADLNHYERNARTHPREQLDQIKALIRLVGFTAPILIDAEGIIAGHGRHIAVTEMTAADDVIHGPGKRFVIPHGMIPAIEADGMSEAERRAFIIADNQVAANSGWDDRLLSGELHALKALDFDLNFTGFEPGRIAELINVPDFQPVQFNAGTRLDQKSKHTCPECGHEF
jgi:ParB-like chromosome segregation protein Spo0J